MTIFMNSLKLDSLITKQTTTSYFYAEKDKKDPSIAVDKIMMQINSTVQGPFLQWVALLFIYLGCQLTLVKKYSMYNTATECIHTYQDLGILFEQDNMLQMICTSLQWRQPKVDCKALPFFLLRISVNTKAKRQNLNFVYTHKWSTNHTACSTVHNTTNVHTNIKLYFLALCKCTWVQYDHETRCR